MKKIHFANITSSTLGPFDLFIKLHQLHLETIFSNVCVMLSIFFCTIPVSVASAEQSFSTLAKVKNVLRSSMCQNRLSSLGVLAAEAPEARKLSFDLIIDHFAVLEARKAALC